MKKNLTQSQREPQTAERRLGEVPGGEILNRGDAETRRINSFQPPRLRVSAVKTEAYVEFSPHEIEALRLQREIDDLLSGRQARPLFGSALGHEQCADCGHMTPRRHLK